MTYNVSVLLETTDILCILILCCISTAIYNSEPNFTFPVLSEYMQTKTLEENGEGELLGFNAVATKLLGVVTAPIQNALSSKQTQVQHTVHM